MPEHSAPLPSTSRVRRIIDLIGFLVGIGLLTWLIVIAVRDGDWQQVMEADRRLLAGLVGCTVLSAVLTGATFWVTVRPVKRLGFMELQGVNLVASMLNYAPVRLGMLSRFAWHMRVDAMRLLDILAWFASVAVLIAAGLVICSVATLLEPGVGAFWWILILLGTLGAGFVLGLVPRIPFVRKHGRGVDQILASGSARWGGWSFACSTSEPLQAASPSPWPFWASPWLRHTSWCLRSWPCLPISFRSGVSGSASSPWHGQRPVSVRTR